MRYTQRRLVSDLNGASLLTEKNLRILCVDDDPDITTIVRISLEARGDIEIETALSAVEAVEKAPVFKPDLFLLDVMMPGIDGIELFKGLSENPEWASAPVVFLTARCSPEDVEGYLKLGALGVVEKPFKPTELHSQLLRLWENR